MAAAPKTKDHIIRSAIDVLQAYGTEGLTMRKVAGEANMSLGNLQYHFKDKASLMGGLAEYYFGECSSMLDGYQHSPAHGSPEEQLHRFIGSLLEHVDHGDQISDMCRVFREMWALSTRDSGIHRQLVNYYQVTTEKLAAVLFPITSNEQSANQLASVILTYIEGYSITSEALPVDRKETAQMLTTLCRVFLRHSAPSS